MEKRDKIKIVRRIFFVIVLLFLIFYLVSIDNALRTFDEGLRAKAYSTSIDFKEVNQTIFITSRRWGLGGQHFHTVISNIDRASNKVFIDKEKDIVLDRICGFYYKKQEPDSLFIFLPSYSYTDERESYRQVGDVYIKIIEVKNKTYNSFKNNYKTLGLTPILYCDSLR